MNSIYHSQFGKIHVLKDSLNKCWFSILDLLPILGFKSMEEVTKYVPSKFMKHFDERQSSVKDGVSTVNETGLLFLVMKSDAKYTNLFTEWIVDQALPQVRNYEIYYGRYNRLRIKPINPEERLALNKIKDHLRKGDLLKISEITGKSKSLISNTMNGLVRNEGVVSLAFSMAIFNQKDSMLDDYYDKNLISEINARLS